MKAAVYRGPKRIEIAPQPVPQPGPGEVRVKIRACGVCGTDLHLYSTPGFVEPGRVMGHEMAGTVDALGPDVAGPSPGEPVVVEPLLSCGSCRWCGQGRHSICPDFGVYGIHRNGGFAEYAVVPASGLYSIPEDLDFHLAALAEPVAVAVHGLKLAHFQPDQRLLVLGAGAIGLLVVAVAHALGGREISLTARHPHQAEMGKALGAKRVLSATESTPQALTEWARSHAADLVVESVGGQAQTLQAAGAALAPGGTISVLGVFLGPQEIDPLALLVKEATMVWSNCYARPPGKSDFEVALELIHRHRDTMALLLTHRLALEKIQEAFSIAGDKTTGSVKVSIAP